MFDDTQVLLKLGIAAAKAGEKEQARSYFNRVLIREPSPDDRIEAWYWLSEIATDAEEQAMYLEQILIRDPNEPRARRKWAILKGDLKPEEIVNPDAVQPTPVQPPQEVGAKRFTCPNCGGKMVYGEDGQTLVCEYCESISRKKRLAEIIERRTRAEEHDFILTLATAKGHSVPRQINTFACKGCGVAFILPPSRLTITCPYCGSAYVLEQNESREQILPDAVIPFQLNFQQITDAMKEWLKIEPLPGPIKVARGSGVYLPVWVFEVSGSLSWKCEVEIGNRWLPRQGVEPLIPRSVVVPAARRVPRTFPVLLKTFQINKAVPYEEQYLVNFIAETYDIPVSDASLDARKIVLDRESARLEAQLNLPVRDWQVSSRGLAVVSYQLLLVPLWVTYYLCKEQRFVILVNGQTAEVTGERPARGLKRLLEGLLD